MMEQRDSSNIDFEAIARILSEEASTYEVEVFQKWLAASEDNRELFASAKIMWTESSSDHFNAENTTFQPNTEVAWNRVQARIQPKTISINRFWWVQVAAAVMLVAGLIWAIVNWTTPPQELLVEVGDTPANISLVDGSTINANAGSVLSYAKTFDVTERRVKLKGEAFFEVTPDMAKPFVVEAGKLSIMVLGTSFNVNASSTDSILVFVETGKVELNIDDQTSSLTPGETGIYRRSDDYLEKVVEQPITNHFWRNRRLVFRKTKLKDVLRTLGESYQVKLVLADEKLKNQTITVRFEDQELESILDILCATLNLRYEGKPNQEIVLYEADDE